LENSRLTNKVMNPLCQNPFCGPYHMKLGRSEPNPSNQVTSDRVLSILHAWRNLREKNISFLEVGIPLFHFGIWAFPQGGYHPFFSINRLHRDKRGKLVIRTCDIAFSRV